MIAIINIIGIAFGCKLIIIGTEVHIFIMIILK